MQRVRTAVLMSALLALAACGVLPPANLIAPRLSFSDLAIRDVGLSEIRFALQVSAENPNEVDIPLRNVAFELDLLGSAFASGTVAGGQVDLPAHGQREIPVEFTVPTMRLIEVFARLRDASLEGPVYRLRGSATWGHSGIAIPFERSGDLEALRRLRQILGTPASRARGPTDPGARDALLRYSISS